MKKRLLVTLTITLLTIVGCHQEQYQPAAGPLANERKPLLLVSFDGFHPSYLDKVPTPHFDSLAAQGVLSEGLIPIFPTKTFPNHYAIVTGLYPENSGFVGNTMYDPKWDEWYRIRDREAVESGKWYGGEPIWNTLEKQGLRTGTMFWVGSEADIQDRRPSYWKTYDESMSEKARIDTVVKWMSYPDERAVDFATLYFEHVDSRGHNYGTDSEELKAAIRQADKQVGYLKKRLQEERLWEQMNVIILSDHGMVNLSADKTIELNRLVNMQDIKRTIWGPLTMIQPKEGKVDKVYRALKEKEKHYRVYKKEDLPERYHLKDHRRVSDILMIADLGYVILETKDKEPFLESLPQATHGYDNQEKAMRALFLARGPAFKKGKNVPPFQNIHIYELLNHLMESEPAPNDGSLDSVRVLLQ